MSASYFSEKILQPDDTLLAQALGTTKRYWDAIIDFAMEKSDALSHEWKYYGKKHGWQLKLIYKKRAVLYMIPHDGSFLTGMAFRESALESLSASGLPLELIDEIKGEKTYPEGKPARVEVSTGEQVEVVKKLIGIKLDSLG